MRGGDRYDKSKNEGFGQKQGEGDRTARGTAMKITVINSYIIMFLDYIIITVIFIAVPPPFDQSEAPKTEGGGPLRNFSKNNKII